MHEIAKIAIFKGRKIRKIIYLNEWWFSVIDVVGALTDSVNARDYWFKMKIRVKNDDGIELSTICRQLEQKSGQKVSTSGNYLKTPQEQAFYQRAVGYKKP